MSYACFVKDVYECIKRYSDNDAFSLSVFAEVQFGKYESFSVKTE